MVSWGFSAALFETLFWALFMSASEEALNHSATVFTNRSSSDFPKIPPNGICTLPLIQESLVDTKGYLPEERRPIYRQAESLMIYIELL
jgi:hypothetical protein